MGKYSFKKKKSAHAEFVRFGRGEMGGQMKFEKKSAHLKK
jgi:hypothetical protein